ncbi:acyl-CoA dehydrogenase family protein [Actinophytocola oryzae]|uniref:Alkylation response protein AidB-like acyl-CoA dehydrogenase n=1 Tax=Actinophytocola oryzae TaxID=502181 RepID=A0A4R7W126_9PSEU|nr:acyl-CoA dehydrogenase family protein [Actinophytocola oryzae]TDV56233.1 alkylation response protein AidB-like acyl-CoA dehydrogenase [Actinophytocola oryzae]
MDFELSQQQQLFGKTVRDWVEREAPKSWARELERDETAFPHALWRKISEAGFHGVGIAEEYGGQGGDVLDQVLLARGLARSLGGLTWVWGITSFAGSKSVGVYGTSEQKRQHLPAIAEGREKWAIGFTEPGGGTDVLGALRTRGRKVDGGWVINGQKTWSSMSHVADYILLLARTQDYVEKRHQGVSLFILPTDAAGVTTREIPKLGMRALGSCDVFLDDVFVPDENVLGEPGRAWHQLLPTLNNERIVLSALCLGIMDGVLEDAVRYAGERTAFGGPIGRFQAVQHYLADIAMWRDQAELMVYRAAWLQSLGRPCGQEANMAKVVASELVGKAADLGLQILGGMGYSAETDMQRYWRDARLFRIGPVTNEMARNGIAEALGMPRSY